MLRCSAALVALRNVPATKVLRRCRISTIEQINGFQTLLNPSLPVTLRLD